MKNFKLVIKDYYPKDRYIVSVEDDLERVKTCLKSKGVTCWAQGEMKGTGYFKLAQISPSKKGEKVSIIICEMSLIDQLK